MDYNSVVTASLTAGNGNGDGLLSFKDGVKLDYEVQREYRVTITATDPSGDRRRSQSHRQRHERERRAEVGTVKG